MIEAVNVLVRKALFVSIFILACSVEWISWIASGWCWFVIFGCIGHILEGLLGREKTSLPLYGYIVFLADLVLGFWLLEQGQKFWGLTILATSIYAALNVVLGLTVEEEGEA